MEQNKTSKFRAIKNHINKHDNERWIAAATALNFLHSRFRDLLETCGQPDCPEDYTEQYQKFQEAIHVATKDLIELSENQSCFGDKFVFTKKEIYKGTFEWFLLKRPPNYWQSDW